MPVGFASLKGCDVAPIDLTDSDQAMRLRAYIWVEQTERFERLEAAIAEAGGFAPDGIGACPVARLAYISLSGAEPPGKIADIATGGASALGAEALAGLTRKIAAFDNEAVPYLSRPHPMFASRYADYDHLARVKEWARDAAGESQ
ncbi:MAG TPA: DUF2332 family protein [Hyphomicrobiales bacterium]|nr:DUF2332 family protein [Hyphomicrobiales bacterium]